MKLTKKGQTGGWATILTGGAVAVLVVVMLVAFGLQFLTDTQSNFVTNTAGCNSTVTTGCGYAYNATGDGLVGLSKFTDNIGTIALAVVLLAVIGLVIGLVYMRR